MAVTSAPKPNLFLIKHETHIPVGGASQIQILAREKSLNWLFHLQRSIKKRELNRWARSEAGGEAEMRKVHTEQSLNIDCEC